MDWRPSDSRISRLILRFFGTVLSVKAAKISLVSRKQGSELSDRSSPDEKTDWSVKKGGED